MGNFDIATMSKTEILNSPSFKWTYRGVMWAKFNHTSSSQILITVAQSISEALSFVHRKIQLDVVLFDHF